MNAQAVCGVAAVAADCMNYLLPVPMGYGSLKLPRKTQEGIFNAL